MEGDISVRCQKEQTYAENVVRHLRIKNISVSWSLFDNFYSYNSRQCRAHLVSFKKKHKMKFTRNGYAHDFIFPYHTIENNLINLQVELLILPLDFQK